jgi:PD-(D/E)XK nuclease superfamily protein
MSVFSITDRGTWRRCRRQWDYSSNARRNLTKVGSGPPALELGGLIHLALAEWVLNPEENMANLFQLHAADRVEEVSKAYKEIVGASISTEELGPILDNVKLGTAMCTNYQNYYGTPLPPDMRFAAVEQEVVVDVPGTNHKVSATLDGLLQDKRDLLYVDENKTFHPRYRPTWESLNMNDQFTGYAWVLRQLDIGKVAGVAYNGLCKQMAPTRGKDIESLFLRKVIPKTNEQLDEWGRNLTLEINEMANNPEIYPNVPWQGCDDCRFRDLCQAQMNGASQDEIEILIARNYTQRTTKRIQGIRDEE